MKLIWDMRIIFGSKIRHYVARVGIFLVMAALIAGIPSSCAVGPDNSNPSQNLEIRTWYDLDAVRDNLAGNHILMNDLDSTIPGYDELAGLTANQGKGWEPIGFLKPPPDSTGCTQLAVASSPDWFDGLTGTLDGRGFEICDLFINRPDESYVGLFAFVEGGRVRNIGVVNATVGGDRDVGSLVGYKGGIVSNCYSSGNVTGHSGAGGLVGHNGGTLTNSYSTGNVTGHAHHVGGLVGANQGTVTDSHSSTNVIGEDSVGGLVGWNGWADVFDSYSTGNVTGSENVGGLVGSYWAGAISNSHYNYDEVLINGNNMITIGALFGEDFDQWLANDKFLDVNERLSQENGYYGVSNISDFKELLAFGQNASLKFTLNSDLELATEPNFYIPYFAGEFDGNGHKISDLSLNLDFVSQVGLFGYLVPDGRITDLVVENVNITGLYCVGGLVGESPDGSLSHSYTTGSVAGESAVGGLVGENKFGTVSNSYSTSDVTGRSLVGGLVGHNLDTVSDCYATGAVTGEELVGGLVGYQLVGNVSDCYSTGTVNGEELVGGLVGQNVEGTVNNSFWDTETSGQATSDGGTGKTTAEMKSITTFSGAGWDICAVGSGSNNSTYTWNIVNGVTYPFLSWQS